MSFIRTRLCLVPMSTVAQQVQPIETRVLKSEEQMHLTIHQNVATTLLFPSPVGGTFGLGLVSQLSQQNQNGASSQGVVQMDHPEGSPIMVLHALSPTTKVIMTVH